MSRFSDSFLDQIRERVPISTVVGQRVTWDRKKTSTTRGDYWACCPWHGEKSPSFHCEDKKGRYHCFGCGVSGDHFRFLMEMDGMSFPDAVADLASLAGIPMPDRGPPTDAQKAEAARRAREREKMHAQRAAIAVQHLKERVLNAAVVWKSSQPIRGTLGQVYVEWRGLLLPEVEENLRFHPGLAHSTGNDALDVPGRHPTIVARVQGPDGGGRGVWRIYLKADGRGKLAVPEKSSAKVGLGPTGGGAVRLGGIGPIIGLAEGVETALAVRELGVRYPVWAATSTSGIISFEIPPGVERVIVYPDPDRNKLMTRTRHDGTTFVAQPPGLEAARRFVENNPGRDIRIAESAYQADYLEVLQRAKGVPVR